MQCSSTIIIKNLSSNTRIITIDLEWQISYFIKYVETLIKTNVLDFLPSDLINNLKFVHNGISINIFESKCMLEVTDFGKSLRELGIKNNDIVYVFKKADSSLNLKKEDNIEADFEFNDTFEYGKSSCSQSTIINSGIINSDNIDKKQSLTPTPSISQNISYIKPPIGPSSAPSPVAPIAIKTPSRRIIRTESSGSIILEVNADGIYDRASDSYTMLSLSPQDRTLIEDLKNENLELRSELQEIKQYLKCIVKSNVLNESKMSTTDSFEGSILEEKNNETDNDTNSDCIL
jgi:hypothetical protein